MSVLYSRISTAPVSLVCLFTSWALVLLGPATSRAADGGDRLGEMIMATGPVLVRYDEATKAPIPLDALYILDYKSGRLLASLPTFRQSTLSTTILESFVERDLAADFKLDPDRGPRPHFLMTTGSLGPYTAGWAPLYVIETASNQIGVYRLHLQETTGQAGRPKFELLQMRNYLNSTAAKPEDERGDSLRTGQTTMTTGPVLVSFDQATKAPIPLDALYILAYDGSRGARLVASLPTFRQSPQSTTIIESFVERDLAADFKIELDRGPRPRFLMTTGSLGPYTAGWAPLYVIETTTNQIAVYRLHLQDSSGKSGHPKFELVQLRPYIGSSAAKPADE
jgi:hypothetical protein